MRRNIFGKEIAKFDLQDLKSKKFSDRSSFLQDMQNLKFF